MEINSARRAAWRVHQHQVILFHPTLSERGPQSVVPRHSPRHQQRPRGVPVQTMDHTKVTSSTKFAEFRAESTGHETVQQRIVLMAPTRLHHPASGFVEHQVMGIFVRHLDSDRSIGHRGRQGATPRLGTRPRSIIFSSTACSKKPGCSARLSQLQYAHGYQPRASVSG